MIEQEFILKWKSIDFSTYNEADIREEFIAPLLNILGYSKNTVNDIIRERTLQLTEPYQRIGRKRVSIDYAPTIRLKSFWILEAKPGNIKKMDRGDLLQAFLYATHPEIQAQYVVLCNGWNLHIYDVYQVIDWDKPFFCINKNDCEEKFNELMEILSAKTMLEVRRKKILNQITNTFEVELDVEQLKAFKREFESMQYPLERKINENVRNLQREDSERRLREEHEHIQSIDTNRLLGQMELSGPQKVNLYMEYYKRIEKATPSERSNLLKNLMQRYLGRCHAEFKYDCLAIYLEVVENNLEVAKSPFLNNPKTTLCNIIKGNLTYHNNSKLLNALAYLDKMCYKFAYFFIRTSLMNNLSKYIKDKRTHMAIDELIVKRPSVAGEMVRLINIYVDYLWRYLSNGDTTEIWRNIHVLNYILKPIENLKLPKYPDGDNDLLWYNYYGDNFDFLFRVSHMLLHGRVSVIENLDIDANVLEIIRLEEKEAKKFIPQMPIIEGEPNEEDIKSVIDRTLIALVKTIELWNHLAQI